MTTASSPGPLSMLTGCLLPVAGALAIRSAAPGLIGIGLELAAFGWLVRDWHRTLRGLAFGAVAAAGIAFTTWLYGGHDVDETAAAALRILYLVLPSALLLPLIRPSSLADHLAQRLHLPARGVVAASAALQRVDSIGDSWRQVQRARRSRGLGADGTPVRWVRASAGSAFALLVTELRQAGLLAVAMDARGFQTAHRRTWAEDAPWHRRDTLILLLAVGLGALPWLLR